MSVVLKCLASLASLSATGALDWGSMTPGTISFKRMGICGNGEDSFIGMIEPETVTEPTKIFMEIMGGAICFSKESCSNSYIGSRTMSITSLLVDHMHVPAEMLAFFMSGAGIPMSMLQPMQPGFLPYPGSGHPMEGRRGVFMISCTGDINLGRRNVTYAARTDMVSDALTTCDETNEGLGEAYRGCQNRTQSGFACDAWASRIASIEAEGIENHNYCRNPDGISQLWCYTSLSDSGFRWDYCEPVGVDPVVYHAHHLGGQSMQLALDSFQRDFDSITEISLYGGSGGGVASVAWAPIVADIFPEAEVRVLADSALHVFPGNRLFQAFYDIALWGPGHDAGQGDGIETGVQVPDFDWRAIDAVAAHISSFDGRVKVGYFGCVDDGTVYADRLIMGMLAGLADTAAELQDHTTQHEDTWRFLSAMHKCSSPASIYSYIQDCTEHTQTRTLGWSTPVPGPVSPRQFVWNFLMNNDTGFESGTQFWYEAHDTAGDEVECSSPVRRRRGVTPTTTDSPADTPADTGSGSGTGNSNGYGLEDQESSSLPCSLPGTLAVAVAAAAGLAQ